MSIVVALLSLEDGVNFQIIIYLLVISMMNRRVQETASDVIGQLHLVAIIVHLRIVYEYWMPICIQAPTAVKVILIRTKASLFGASLAPSHPCCNFYNTTHTISINFKIKIVEKFSPSIIIKPCIS